MKIRFVWLVCSVWLLASTVVAQEPSELGTVYDSTTAPVSTTATAPVPPPAPEESKKERKVYSKKVRGLLWFEGTVGWARVEPNNFKTLNINRGNEQFKVPQISEEGPEYGGAVGVQLGSFTIGLRYKTAKLDTFDFNTLAVDLGFMLRFVPGVHPFFRTLLAYNFTKGSMDLGNAEQYRNVEADGGGASIGGGLRIPIIKWISIDAAVDYQMYGLYVRGELNGNNFKKGMAGSSLSISGALTFHFIQRHK